MDAARLETEWKGCFSRPATRTVATSYVSVQYAVAGVLSQLKQLLRRKPYLVQLSHLDAAMATVFCSKV